MELKTILDSIFSEIWVGSFLINSVHIVYIGNVLHRLEWNAATVGIRPKTSLNVRHVEQNSLLRQHRLHLPSVWIFYSPHEGVQVNF